MTGNRVRHDGVDKATFQKAHDLYKDAKYAELKRMLRNADTDVVEAIVDTIIQYDPKTFKAMYPRAKKGDTLANIIGELDEARAPKIPKNYAAMMSKKRKSLPDDFAIGDQIRIQGHRGWLVIHDAEMDKVWVHPQGKTIYDDDMLVYHSEVIDYRSK